MHNDNDEFEFGKKPGDLIIDSGSPYFTLEHAANMMRLLAAVEPEHISDGRAATAYSMLANHCAKAVEYAHHQFREQERKPEAA
ncbi:hypothetical protein J2T55_000796 [Methylohalomonas lacus]|uniref:DUF3077 domain-containing protein n=1 Tax=Methylohalomonas lacus TaxID=398773 RepID=A0AAE3HLU0_9GAMM|nr:hypothetical protein [Methylohalomonas lacus]MCS3902792.1 hypothetical protein [Methylohalomonas lacus]